jgi:hypothetical protein
MADVPRVVGVRDRLSSACLEWPQEVVGLTLIGSTLFCCHPEQWAENAFAGGPRGTDVARNCKTRQPRSTNSEEAIGGSPDRMVVP